MASAGWTIRCQTKTYGKYVTAALDGSGTTIYVVDNPMRLTLPETHHPHLDAPEKVDRICWQLETIIREFEEMQTRKDRKDAAADPLAVGSSEVSA